MLDFPVQRFVVILNLLDTVLAVVGLPDAKTRLATTLLTSLRELRADLKVLFELIQSEGLWFLLLTVALVRTLILELALQFAYLLVIHHLVIRPSRLFFLNSLLSSFRPGLGHTSIRIGAVFVTTGARVELKLVKEPLLDVLVEILAQLRLPHQILPSMTAILIGLLLLSKAVPLVVLRTGHLLQLRLRRVAVAEAIPLLVALVEVQAGLAEDLIAAVALNRIYGNVAAEEALQLSERLFVDSVWLFDHIAVEKLGRWSDFG